IRENALKRILWHKQQGDQVVVVSASLSVYLESWCKSLDLDVISNLLGGLTGGSLLGGVTSTVSSVTNTTHTIVPTSLLTDN
ncbi:haloacid dehalogenase-like hydrolase, partial [Acinetobacter baumannii]|uniref:haloacid dehalogenase-like hydrolase n=1 Tax=Acinetobacter baumannii TaxID=470 RepID=UPI001CB7B501